MKRILKQLRIVFFIFISARIWASDAIEYKILYDDKALELLLEQGAWSDSSEQEDIAYWLFWVLNEKESSLERIESAALHALQIITDRIESGDVSAESYYRLAKLYHGMITDASSWIKYSSFEEKYLDMCLSLDPHHKEARIYEIENLLFSPVNAGGNENRGYEQLGVLNSDFPDDSDVLEVYADYYLFKEDHSQAKDFYKRILKLAPNHYQAKLKYNELVLIDKALPIGNISINDGLKTRFGNKLDSIKEWEGKIYTQESRIEIESLAFSLPSITGVKIKTFENEKGILDLSLEIEEDNTRVFAILAGAGATGNYENTPVVSGFPVLLYRDQNLFGSGNNFMVSFAGVYLGIDFTISERTGFPLNLTFHGDALFLPAKLGYIENGLENDRGVTTPAYNGSITFEKEILKGLYFASNHTLRINNYKGGDSGFITPENNLTYTGNLEFKFSTIQSSFPSAFSLSEGFSISVLPSIIFKPDYRSWGPSTDPFVHNDLPGGAVVSTIQYYNAPSKRFYIGGSIAHYWGINLYETEKWQIGQTDLMSSGPRLSGYLTGEYRSKNALTANLDGHFQFIENTFLLYVKHDMYFDLDTKIFRQGSALGLAATFPYEIEMTLEAGIGWNARRDKGPGWSVQLNLSRYFFW